MNLFFRSGAKADQAASRRILLIVALCLFIVALALVIIQSIPGSRLKIKTYADGYAEGFANAREMTKTRVPFLVGSHSLSGTVISKSGDSMKVKDSNLFVDEAVDGIGNVRTVKIGANTKIVRRSERSSEEMAKEMGVFEVAMNAFDPDTGASPPAPPAPYAETSVSLNDIAVGDHILAVPEDREVDLLTTEAFIASTISVLGGE